MTSSMRSLICGLLLDVAGNARLCNVPQGGSVEPLCHPRSRAAKAGIQFVTSTAADGETPRASSPGSSRVVFWILAFARMTSGCASRLSWPGRARP